MNLELRATPEEVMRAVDTLRVFGEARHIPEMVLFGLTLALEECGSNIVNHALHRDAGQTFQVSFKWEKSTISIELCDRGPEFDPTQVIPAAPDDDRPPGGWGIQLVRRYCDDIQYQRKAGENHLRIFKRLDPPTSDNPVQT